MAQILDRKTRLKVKQAEEGETIKAGWVYTAPSDHHLLVRPDGTVALTPPAWSTSCGPRATFCSSRSRRATEHGQSQLSRPGPGSTELPELGRSNKVEAW